MHDNLIYIKADMSVNVQSQVIYLKNIVKLFGVNESLIRKVSELEIFRITDNKPRKYSVTILKVIEAIQKEYPNTLVINVGESDFVVEYLSENKKRKAFELVKTIFVGLTVFFGSAFTIMTFNQDVNVKDVLKLLNHLVIGESTHGQLVIELSYSLGLPLGIILFFNHFSRIKMNSDPTPLQVQLRLIERNENSTIIENSSREGNSIDVD